MPALLNNERLLNYERFNYNYLHNCVRQYTCCCSDFFI